MLIVSWTPTPGAAFSPISSDVLSNRLGCPCHGGLYFEAYTFDTNPNGFSDLMSIAETASLDVWVEGWTPQVQHEEHTDEIWYENDDQFVDEIDEFGELDHYVMRWRGEIAISAPGEYGFKTASDDGSLLLIDGEVVVNNDVSQHLVSLLPTAATAAPTAATALRFRAESVLSCGGGDAGKSWDH